MNWSSSGRRFFLQFVKNSDRECTPAIVQFSIDRKITGDLKAFTNEGACFFGTMFAKMVSGFDYANEIFCCQDLVTQVKFGAKLL